MGIEVMAEAETESAATQGRHELSSELGLLSQPDGSASFSIGDTSILAAVYGPVEVRMNRELVDRATVDVSYKGKVGLPGCAGKFQERLIRNTCETVILTSLHPRTAINVTVQEIQNSGSLLACCINAACLALLNACVPMKYLVAGISCAISDKGDLFLDPTRQQEEEATVYMTFCFDSKDHNVLTSSTRGAYSNEQFQQCLLACRQASKNIFSFYRKAMEQKLSKLQYHE